MDYLERIKSIKSQKKMTNEQLSELTNISVSTLSKILAGFTDSPKLSYIASICEALGCTVDYVLTGVSENKNNYTLDENEIYLIETYRSLDEHGQAMVDIVLEKEYERLSDGRQIVRGGYRTNESNNDGAENDEARSYGFKKRKLPLYDLPVSAGKGEYLNEENAAQINIPDNEKTENADYALRISGNSMEPKYRNGDILLVENADTVEPGELGIFVLDGDGFFKKYGGDRLISLNPEYGDILLRSFNDVHCVGHVIGKLKRR